ncbi:hypothetical protein MTO96_050054, partial [Rhipicephalus appendiculatus]
TGDEDKENRIWKFVCATRQLPVVNRAVLSMLLVHLRGVSTTSLGGDGRSLDELAAVFAPVVVGCSTSSPSTGGTREGQTPAGSDVTMKCELYEWLHIGTDVDFYIILLLVGQIMHCLLGVPDTYWTDNAAAGGYEPAQQETRPGTAAEDCCVSRWTDVVKRKIK